MAEVVQVWDNQEFGTNIVGTLYDNGLLALTGSGVMNNFAWDASPVYDDARVVSLSIEEGITTVGNYSFYNCSNMTTASFPDSMEEIYSNSFYNCNLSAFTIPQSLTYIGQDVFRNNNLQSLVVNQEITVFSGTFRNNPFPNGVTINANITNAATGGVFRDCNLGDRLTLGSSVTSIAVSLFSHAGLTEITLPAAVTSIGETAFWENPALTEFTFPENVASIGPWAFGQGWASENNIAVFYNYYDGNQTIGTDAFEDCGNGVVGDKYAYCYASNTNFINAVEAEGYIVETWGVVSDADITSPSAKVSATGVTPTEITVAVTGVSVFPPSAKIDVDQLLAVTAILSPSNPSNPKVYWSSDNEAVATVSSAGVVKGVSEGTANITVTTDDGSYTDSCAVTVEEYVPAEYTFLEVLEKDLDTVIHSIDNVELKSLVINKELGGSVGLSFSMPYTADAVYHITAGRYIKCEEQWYYLENIGEKRGADGNPLLDVRATHIFFEIENLQANVSNAAYTTILPALQVLLAPYGISVIGANADHPLYNTTRYIEYEEGTPIIECMKAIFRPFFASYRLDNLTLIVIPSVGEISDSGVEFEYAVNNQEIMKEADYSDIITRLHAEGDDIKYTADAPDLIKALYRQERERTLQFSGVSSMSDLQYLANTYLQHKQLPLTTYRLSVAELKHISNIEELYPGRPFKIEIGQKVTVKDDEFGVLKESVVQRYSYRPLEPDHASSVLIGDLKPYDIAFTEPKDEKGNRGVGGGGDDPWSGFPEPPGKCEPLHGIISTEDPDEEGTYEEDCLWFKY